ncbi:carnitine/acyl carnitine carrier [Meredithblackwellia eburnea MCA 4105]
MSDSSGEKPIDPKLDFFAGTVAGVASLLCGHPFDTVKVRLQCQETGAPAYRNAWHAFLSIIKEEKVSGLYKGVTSPMLGVAAVNASVFGFYGLAMRFQLDNPADTPTLTQICIAGTTSGFFTSALTTPIERLKILQQTYPSHLPEPTLLSLLRRSSLRSLYRGLTPTILRDTAYGPYFLTYEVVSRGWPATQGRYHADLHEEIESETKEVGWARLLLAGGAAGIVGWGSTFAIDVVKSRMQATEPYIPIPAPNSKSIESSSLVLERKPHPYRTTWSTFVNSYEAEGWKVFTSGLGPTLLRSIPVNMVCFVVFEAVIGAFR